MTAGGALAGKRALITGADVYMGPAIQQRFLAEGAEVIADTGDYNLDPDEPALVVRDAGRVDILILNLPGHACFEQRAAMLVPAHKVGEALRQRVYDCIVFPTLRFVAAVLPQMMERRAGKIIAVTSAAPLRSTNDFSLYASARAAQHGYIRAVGSEVAPYNIQVNAVAQTFTIGGFAADAVDDPAIRDIVSTQVPARRLATGEEQAAFVLFLAAQESGFFCGEVFPFTGGWTHGGV